MRSKNEGILRKIVEIINDGYFQDGNAPSMKDIAQELNISVATVSRYVNTLIDRGEIERIGRYGELRTPIIINNIDGNNRSPLIGEIACGAPLLAEENVEYYVNLPKNLFGNGNLFILRAKGNSMINVGIENGDLVVVRQQETAEQGEIIVALIDNEATLKRYYWDKKRKKVRLHPENDEMEDMFYSSITIQGVAIKVIKDIK